MVLKKAWIPVTTAFPTDEDPATVDTKNGTAYSAESGSDPYYPRGVVRAIAPSTINSGAPHLRTVKEESSDVTAVPDEEKNEPDDEDDAAEDAIRPSEMEDGLRSLVLCASLCNMATIHREKDSDDSRWAASGDATGKLSDLPCILHFSSLC
jgi:Na+-exporting ATPase